MKHILITSVIIIFMTGCAQPRVVDDINMSQAVGYDAKKNHKLKGTFVIPIFKEESHGESVIKKGTSATIGDLLSSVSKKSAYPVMLGQSRILLISEDLAKVGNVRKLVDYSYRDPSVGSRQLVVITQGKVEDLLKEKSPQSNLNIGIFLADMVTQTYRYANGTTSNMHVFMRSALENEGDAFLPYIRKKGGEIEVSGLAMLHHNKMISHLSTKYMFVFKILREEHRNGRYQFNLNKGTKSKVVIENIKGGAHYRITTKNGIPHIRIKIKVNGQIKEFSEAQEIGNKKMLSKASREMEKKMIRQAEELVKRFKKQHIDPLELGRKVMAADRHMSRKEWNRIYPSAKIHITAKVKIVQTGTSR